MKRYYAALALFFATALACCSIEAEIKLPSFITDNMVVQNNSKLTLTGNTESGKTVEVIPGWDGKTYRGKTDDKGRFSISIPTPASGGPYDLTVKSGDVTKTLYNILSGEVWLCSGQSNMEFPLNGNWASVMDRDIVVATANHPDIRLLQIKHKTAFTPQDDCDVNMGGWAECTPASVANFSAIAYLFAQEIHGKLKVPVGVIDATWGGTPAEAWTSLGGIEKIEDFEKESDVLKSHAEGKKLMMKEYYTSHYPTVLYNAMIHPLSTMPVKGVLWYQGCANVGRAGQYSKLFKTLIRDWRETWKDNLPFYFVQLAGFRKQMNCQPDSEWALLREAQADALELDNTAMAVAADIGNPVDIHPRNKQEVARRLALIALNRNYGYPEVDTAPVCKEMVQRNGRLILKFDGDLYPTSVALTGFIIAGDDGKFSPACGKLIDSRTIELSASGISNPTKARYGWADYPDGNLYGSTGLPIAPFRTDK